MNYTLQHVRIPARDLVERARAVFGAEGLKAYGLRPEMSRRTNCRPESGAQRCYKRFGFGANPGRLFIHKKSTSHGRPQYYQPLQLRVSKVSLRLIVGVG